MATTSNAGLALERYRNSPTDTFTSFCWIFKGVGLDESLELQGLGILKAIKEGNPAQVVILYSAGPIRLDLLPYAQLADRVLDKNSSYVDYKSIVDEYLKRHLSLGYHVSVINQVLGPDAALAPRVVPVALRAMKRKNLEPLRRYLSRKVSDLQKIDRVLAVVNIAVGVAQIGLVVA